VPFHWFWLEDARRLVHRPGTAQTRGGLYRRDQALADATAAFRYIAWEHMFEHVLYGAGLQLISECHAGLVDGPMIARRSAAVIEPCRPVRPTVCRSARKLHRRDQGPMIRAG
jgi:hypothetical protein